MSTLSTVAHIYWKLGLGIKNAQSACRLRGSWKKKVNNLLFMLLKMTQARHFRHLQEAASSLNPQLREPGPFCFHLILLTFAKTFVALKLIASTLVNSNCMRCFFFLNSINQKERHAIWGSPSVGPQVLWD